MGTIAAGEGTGIGDEPDGRHAQRMVLQTMHAVLSDDHYERGLATLIDLVDRIVRANGAAALRNVEPTLSLALAMTLQRIPQEQGLTARTW